MDPTVSFYLLLKAINTLLYLHGLLKKIQNLWKLIILYLTVATIKFCISVCNTNYDKILVKSGIGFTDTKSIII